MRVAVTGGAGGVGSLVTAGLSARGVDIVALVRDRRRARAPGIEAALVEYDDRASLDTALAGADRLVFIGSDGAADRMLVHHRNILEAATQAGVERIVLLSSQDADPDSPFCYAHTYAVTEAWLPASCPQPVVVRAGLYAEFFGRWVLEAMDAGELSLPMRTGSVAPIARSDVAAALVAAVADPDFQPIAQVVTGARSYDHDQLAGLASELAGRPVRSIPCTPDDFAGALLLSEPSPWWRYAFQTLFAAIELGAFAACTDTLTRLTGRGPLDFAAALAPDRRSG